MWFAVWLPVLYNMSVLFQINTYVYVSSDMYQDNSVWRYWLLDVCLCDSGFDLQHDQLSLFFRCMFVITECDILILLSHWVCFLKVRTGIHFMFYRVSKIRFTWESLILINAFFTQETLGVSHLWWIQNGNTQNNL